MSGLGLAITCCLRTTDSSSGWSVITRIVVAVSTSMNSRLMSQCRGVNQNWFDVRDRILYIKDACRGRLQHLQSVLHS